MIPTEIPVVPTQEPVIPTDVPSVVTEIPAIPTGVPTIPASTTAPLQRNSLAPQSQPAKPKTPTPPPATPTITSIDADCSGSGTLTVDNPVAGATITLVLTYKMPGKGNNEFVQTSNTTTVTLVAGQTSYPFTIDTTTGVPSNANTVRVEVKSTSIGVNGETTKSGSFGPCGAAPTVTPLTPTVTPVTPSPTTTNTVEPTATNTVAPTTVTFTVKKTPTPTSAASAGQGLPNTGAGPQNPGSGSSDSIWLMIFAIVTLAGAAISRRIVYARKRR